MTPLPDRLARWAREAKRRKVYTSVVAYIIVAVTIIELSGALFEALLLPDWSSRLVTVLLILGFPVVALLAWTFDVTSEGVERTGGAGTEADGGTTLEGAAPSHVGGNGGARPRPRGGGRSTNPPPKVRRVSRNPGGSAGRPGADRTGVPADSPGSSSADGHASTPPEVSGDAHEAPDARPTAPPDPERVKQAALAHVRHELKTPINGILGYSEMLLEDLEGSSGETGDAAAEVVVDLTRIRTAGRSLVGLVDEILNPARIAEEGAGTALEDYGAKIRADLRNPVNAVIGYAELLMETCEEEGLDYVVPDLERIREAARRLLELSTDIVEVATDTDAGAGRLEAASALTEGVMAKARARSGAVSDDGMGSLLVVDDNEMNRDLLSRQLARAGYVVQTAESGHEALDILGRRDFDLVLLDVIMPGMDGLDVLRRVKSDERTADIPVMMLSSLDDVESAIRCIELGADDFLHKPFHPTLLQARIGASLEIRHMREEDARHRERLNESEAFADRLLRSAFPDAIARRIRAGESDIVESYGEATVLWCDVEGSARTRARDAGHVAGRIQRLLEALERVSEQHELETLAHAGEGVVVAGGVPVPADDHAHRIAAAALTLTRALAEDDDFDAPVRIGLDSGEVTGGVLGGERLGYRLWGDPVDLAQRLGEHTRDGQVLVSPGAFRLLRDEWTFATPGVREIPGRGQMKTYILEGPA